MKTIKAVVIIFLLVAVGSIVFFVFLNEKGEKQLVNQESVRDRDIAVIKKFSDNQNAEVEFVEAGRSANGLNVPVNIYYLGAYQYEVDTMGKVVEFRSRDLPIGSENEKAIDNTPRYSQQDLENMARQFIANNTNLNFDRLTSNHGVKGTNYFFKWEDRTIKTSEGYPFVQIGFSQGGTLLNYFDTF